MPLAWAVASLGACSIMGVAQAIDASMRCCRLRISTPSVLQVFERGVNLCFLLVPQDSSPAAHVLQSQHLPRRSFVHAELRLTMVALTIKCWPFNAGLGGCRDFLSSPAALRHDQCLPFARRRQIASDTMVSPGILFEQCFRCGGLLVRSWTSS